MEHIGKTVRRLREEKGLTQQQIADMIHMHRSNYSKVEKGERDLSLEAVATLADYFKLSIDELVHYTGQPLEEISSHSKTIMEKVRLIEQLDDEEQSMVYNLIDTFLTKKKLKEFFQKNVATL